MGILCLVCFCISLPGIVESMKAAKHVFLCVWGVKDLLLDRFLSSICAYIKSHRSYESTSTNAVRKGHLSQLFVSLEASINRKNMS